MENPEWVCTMYFEWLGNRNVLCGPMDTSLIFIVVYKLMRSKKYLKPLKLRNSEDVNVSIFNFRGSNDLWSVYQLEVDKPTTIRPTLFSTLNTCPGAWNHQSFKIAASPIAGWKSQTNLWVMTAGWLEFPRPRVSRWCFSLTPNLTFAWITHFTI